MRLLLADVLKRKYRWMAPMFGLSVAAFWWGSVSRGGDSSARDAFAASLAVAFMLGPLIAGAGEPRALWYLPISRRDRWRATWLIATVGATTITTSGKLLALLGFGAGESLGLSSIALSSIYDFAYTGAGCWLFIMTTRTLPVHKSWRRRAWLVIAATSMLIFVTGMLWGFAIRNLLPIRWSEISPLGAAILVAGLTVSCATYFHVARPPARLAGSKRRRADPFTQSSAGRLTGLTGLPRLLLHEYLWSAGLGGFLVILFGTLVFVVGAMTHSPASYGGFLRMQQLLLFDGSLAQQRGQIFDLIVWFGLFAATLVSRFPEMIRHLRVLPLHASRLNLLLVAWPALMLLTVWAALLVLHYAVIGQPVASLQPALFLALTGSSALMRAAALRWPSYSPWVFGLTISVVPIVRLVNGPSSAILAAVGLAGITGAAALNHFSLRRSATYRPRPRTFGAVAVQPGF